jgi:YgiT-type zinc finger domain-containing protein
MISKSENEAPNNKGMCRECGTGVLKLQQLTYFTWLNNELITVPDFPAYVCDICGRREYDSRAITWLNTLLNPETGRSSTSQHKAGSAGANQAQP